MTLQLSPSDILPAMEEATIRLFAANHGLAGCELHRTPHQTSTWAPSLSPAMNAVLQTRAPMASQGDLIDEAISRASGRPFLWKLMPGDLHREHLAEQLLGRGFLEMDPSTPIWGQIPQELDLLCAQLPPARTIRTPADFARWLIPFQAAFGLPDSDVDLCQAIAEVADLSESSDIQHVLIESGGQPVACGTLVLQHPTLAAVFNLAVLPDARRAGHGTAILGALAQTARAHGRTHLGQLSTVAGLPLYQHWGRAEGAQCRNFVYLGASS